jgi:hypothetical protein
MRAGQKVVFEDRARGGMLVDVVLRTVDRSAMPPEQEHERGYTVQLPDGRERNTLASRLQLPLDSLEAEELGPAEPAAAPATAPAPTSPLGP